MQGFLKEVLVMVVQLCKYTKNDGVVVFQQMNYVEYELHLSKAV